MPDDSSFASLFAAKGAGSATRRLRAGETIEATVIQISQDSIFVDVGTPSDGRIARAEFVDRTGSLTIKVGDRVRATVVDPRPDGPVLATSFGHGEKLDSGALELARSSGTPVEGEVTKVVKAGLEVSIGGVRAFCPASQIEVSHVADLNVYFGQKLEFRVLEVRDGGRSVVVSRRALLEERRREAALTARERLHVDSDVEGTVQALGRHGAVIDLDGVEGFIHLSELAPHRIERAEDAVKVGERIKARVLSIDDTPKGLRIRLSLRALSGAARSAQQASAEEVLKGQVTRASQHGVFVQTPLGEGLIPLRELGLAPGGDHRRAYPVGRELSVVVVSRGGGRLTLSVKEVARVEERKNYREFAGGGAAPSSGFGSLGDMLKGKIQAVAASPTTTASEVRPEPARQDGVVRRTREPR